MVHLGCTFLSVLFKKYFLLVFFFTFLSNHILLYVISTYKYIHLISDYISLKCNHLPYITGIYMLLKTYSNEFSSLNFWLRILSLEFTYTIMNIILYADSR